MHAAVKKTSLEQFVEINFVSMFSLEKKIPLKVSHRREALWAREKRERDGERERERAE